MLVGLGPVAGADASGDLAFMANGGDGGHSVDHWWVGWAGSEDSGIAYTDGTDHLVVVTYSEADDEYTWYHLEGGSAVAHGTDGPGDWSEQWDEALDYIIGIGTSPNVNVDLDHGPAGEGAWNYFNGNIGMFAIWDRALDTSEMPGIPDLTCVGGATNPIPNDGNDRVDPDGLVLWWTKSPDATANTEDVYFSHDYNDVNDRELAALQSTAQDANYWPTTGDLNDDVNLGQTYFWAIDETNVPDAELLSGSVWSFTVKDSNAGDPSGDAYMGPRRLGQNTQGVLQRR